MGCHFPLQETFQTQGSNLGLLHCRQMLYPLSHPLSICRMAFNGCCPDCKVPGDDCPLVWGQCSHCFHMHCILKWLNAQQVQQHCPMCRQEWKFKE